MICAWYFWVSYGDNLDNTDKTNAKRIKCLYIMIYKNYIINNKICFDLDEWVFIKLADV